MMKTGGLILAILSLVGLIIIGDSLAGEKTRDWQSDFLQADADKGKHYEIINQAIAAEKAPLGFLSEVINTDKFAKLFPTYCVFRVLQIQTAMWMSKIATKDICEILREFYYGGSHSRILKRPAEYSLYSFYTGWQKPVCEITNPDGTGWALVNISWYGCSNDLWLIKGIPGDSTWEGPWFTGFQSRGLPKIFFREDGTVDSSGYSLRIKNDGVHIISADGALDKLISPEVLNIDSDEDGLYDIEERRFGTDPLDNDTDNDGLFDGIDINPLTVEKKELQPQDYARMVVFMWETTRDIPMDVYFVDISVEDSLEYRVPSPNALVLPITATQVISDDCDCQSWGVFGQQISMGLSVQDELAIGISLSTGDHTTSYCVERLHDIWILTEERETIQY